MKNTNKAELVARLMLVVILVVSATSMCSCKDNIQIDMTQRFNLDDGSIKFLCMEYINQDDSNYIQKDMLWYFCDGIQFSDGTEEYSRPYINCSGGIYVEELGDGRLLYNNGKKVSFTFDAQYYAFQGEIGELRYEFVKNMLFEKRINIYNNNELVGKISFKTRLIISNEVYSYFLDNHLCYIDIEKYTNVIPSTRVPDEIPMGVPNLDVAQHSYLSIRNVENSEDSFEIIEYTSKFSNGFKKMYANYYEYTNAINKVDITMKVNLFDTHLHITAEFYEYREQMGEIEYVFIMDNEFANCVELYSNSILVGKVFYSSEAEISQEWFTSFLNENLVVINVKKYAN